MTNPDGAYLILINNALARIKQAHISYRPADFDDYDVCPSCSTRANILVGIPYGAVNYIRIPAPCAVVSEIEELADEVKNLTRRI